MMVLLLSPSSTLCPFICWLPLLLNWPGGQGLFPGGAFLPQIQVAFKIEFCQKWIGLCLTCVCITTSIEKRKWPLLGLGHLLTSTQIDLTYLWYLWSAQNFFLFLPCWVGNQNVTLCNMCWGKYIHGVSCILSPSPRLLNLFGYILIYLIQHQITYIGFFWRTRFLDPTGCL